MKPDERAVRELSIGQDGEELADLRESPDRMRSAGLTAVIVAAVAVAGLSYGFLLGHGGSTAASPSTSEPTPTTTTTRQTVFPTVVSGPLPQSFLSVRRASPGHDLGNGVSEYLDPNNYQVIATDSDGFIWSGGPSGVVRLDPASGTFTRLTDSTGIGPVDVRAIAAGPDGSMWVASGHGLSYWDGGEWASDSRFPAGRSERNINALEVGVDGRIWLATHTWSVGEGYAEETNQIHWDEPPFVGDVATVTMSDWVHDLEADAAGNVWALAGSRLWQFDGEWREMMSTGVGWFHAMAVGADGAVWLAREGRLLRLDGQELTDFPWTDAPGQPAGYFRDEGFMGWVQALESGPDGTVWALVTGWDPAIERDRWELVHLDEAGVTAHPVPEVDVGDWYGDLAVAPDGGVWLAAGGTIVSFVDAAWSQFRIEDEPALGAIRALSVGTAGDVWIANETGILHQTGDQWQRYGGDDLGLADEYGAETAYYGAFWVTVGPEGSVWGGRGCRVARFSGERWLALPAVPASSEECWAGGIATGADGSLWLTLDAWPERPALYRWDDETWEVIDTPTDGGFSFAIAADGTIWTANDSGIDRSDGEEWIPVMSGVAFDSIAIAGDGSVWAAAAEWSGQGGLWHYDGGAWERTRSGDTINALETGPDGTVWALQHRQDGRAALINAATGRTRWVVEGEIIYAMAIAPDGTIWAGGNSRLYRVDPAD